MFHSLLFIGSPRFFCKPLFEANPGGILEEWLDGGVKKIDSLWAGRLKKGYLAMGSPFPTIVTIRPRHVGYVGQQNQSNESYGIYHLLRTVLSLGVIVTTRIFAIFQEDHQNASFATITGMGYHRRNCEAIVLLFFWQCLHCVDWDDLRFGRSDVLFS